MEIREMNINEIDKFHSELVELLYMVLSENITQKIGYENAHNYYNDMRKYLIDGSAIVIGAFENEKLIGFHWGYEFKIFNERRIHSYLNAINPEFRGKKIGSLFFRKLEELTKARGIDIIEAMVTYSNEVAVNYHLKNGFEIERIKVWKHL